jgi:hypothetical protein
MSLSTVREIERAIRALKPRELEELYSWLDKNYPPPLDNRVQSDLTAGRLDKTIRHALDDENNDRVQPLSYRMWHFAARNFWLVSVYQVL